MEFGKHLGKGLWGIADKALPVIYGVSYVVLVIRVLPEEEFGSFVLLQEIFLILSNLAAAFALHPLLKFAAEETSQQREVVGAAGILNLLFVTAASILAMVLKAPLAQLLNAPALNHLMIYVVAMLGANIVRNLTLVLLQSRFQVQQVFWIDAAHFLVAPGLIYLYSKLGIFDTAHDLLVINIISLSFSSLVGWWMCREALYFTLRPHRDEMRRMWDFGKYATITVASNMLFIKADSFILAAYGGPIQVALYGSVKIFVRIYDMVGQIVQMFVLPASARLSSQNDYGSLKKVVDKGITFTTAAAFPAFLLFAFFAPQIISLIYGTKYADGAPLLQIFSVLSFLVPASSVATNVLLGLGKVRLIFVLSFVILILAIIVYLLLIPQFGAVGATLGYVAGSVLQLVLFGYYLNKIVELRLGDIVRRVNDIWTFFLQRLNSIGIGRRS